MNRIYFTDMVLGFIHKIDTDLRVMEICYMQDAFICNGVVRFLEEKKDDVLPNYHVLNMMDAMMKDPRVANPNYGLECDITITPFMGPTGLMEFPARSDLRLLNVRSIHHLTVRFLSITHYATPPFASIRATGAFVSPRVSDVCDSTR